MKIVSATVLGLAFALLAIPAHSRTWYILADGTGDAPTIRAGMDSAASGDTVLVAAGTYTSTSEGAPSGPWGMISLKSSVSLVSESGPELTTLNAERRHRVIRCYNVAAPASIEGFTLTGGFSEYVVGEGGGGVYCYNSSVLIRGNIITDNIAGGDIGSGGGGIHCHGSPNTVITENTISQNYTAYFGGGILHGVNAPSVTYNLIAENTSDHKGGGICCINMDAEIHHNVIVRNSAPLGAGIYCQETGGEIANNTVVDNSGTEGVGIYFVTSSSPLTSRNIIVGSTGGPALYCDGTGFPTITCNDLYRNELGDGNCTLGSDNFTADPLFCDEASGDYGLHENSPCAPANSPLGCDLVGALPVSCWGAPFGAPGLVLISIGLGAVGAASTAGRRYRKRRRQD